MLTPFFAIAVGIFLDKLLYKILLRSTIVERNSKISLITIFILIIMIVFEIFYSYNNQIAYYPIGSTPWLASKVRYENYNWGYNELGKWIENELRGKVPAITFDLKYKFLEKLRDQAIEKGLENGLEPYPALFVYDGNFDKAAKLWILDRLHIYHGWPIINLKTYYDNLQKEGFDYYERVGFKNYYFIFQTNIVPSPEATVLMRGAPITIQNPRGDEVFKIYKF